MLFYFIPKFKKIMSTSNTNTNTVPTFSEYILFPTNPPTTTTSALQNPFAFRSGLPSLATTTVTPTTPSTPFSFQFPLSQIQIKTKQQTLEEGEESEENIPIPPVETEEQKKKKIQKKLAKTIETYLQERPEDTYCLSRYTLFEIDGVQADVYIGKEEDSYFYHFVSKNIEYVEEDDDGTNDPDDSDFMLLEKNDFDTVMDVLEHMEKVRDTYTFLDFYLLSPEKKEVARNHRAFLPLSQDKICSVCYEPTLEYTTCKHPICLKCREKCIVNSRKMCPVCRSSQLRFYPTELAKL